MLCSQYFSVSVGNVIEIVIQMLLMKRVLLCKIS